MGGEVPAASNVMDYVTIATIGNSTDFGNLTVARGNTAGIGNNTRGLCIGGYASPAYSNVMDYITIASAGNATDFGNLLATKALSADGTGGSSTTRGIIAGGYAGSAGNVIEYITFASTGNATDFGDMLLGSDGSFETSSGFAGWTRALGLAGASPSNKLEYVTIAAAGQGINGTSNCHGGLQS